MHSRLQTAIKEKTGVAVKRTPVFSFELGRKFTPRRPPLASTLTLLVTHERVVSGLAKIFIACECVCHAAFAHDDK